VLFMSSAFINAHRRVYFVKRFRAELRRQKLGNTYSFDCEQFDPVARFVDGFHLLKPLQALGSVDHLINLCSEANVKLLVPWLDADSLVLNQYREILAKNLIRVLLPPSAYVELFTDKVATLSWATERNLVVVDSRSKSAVNFPAVVKPRRGQGGVGVRIVNSYIQFEAATEELIRCGKEPMYQDFVEGIEYTVDCGTTPDGEPHFCIPRRRIKSRSGEVLISQIDCNPRVIDFARSLIANCCFFSVINFQCFLTNTGKVLLSEINPRFSGGIDLTIRAGVNVPRYAVELGYYGEFRTPPPRRINDGLMMTRFFQNIFCSTVKKRNSV
jgi:carbamoyl-phosphate synthase large subunit